MPTLTPLTYALENGTNGLAQIMDILMAADGDVGASGEVETDFGDLAMISSSGIVSTIVMKFEGTNALLVSGLSLSLNAIRSASDAAGGGSFTPLHQLFGGFSYTGDFSEVAGPVSIFGLGGSDVFTLGDFADSYAADGGNDVVDLGKGNDTVAAGGAPFVVSGLSQFDGGRGVDTFFADGIRFVTGQTIDMRSVFTVETDIGSYMAKLTGFECVIGSNFADTITGTSNKEMLQAQNGDDDLTGGRGADTLGGGVGRDDFIYLSVKDSQRGKRDTILDFKSGDDDIDLSAIDPKTRNEKFFFIGERDFSGKAGQLQFEQVDKKNFENDYTFVRADKNGDGKADMEIRLVGLIDLERADFIL